ncbi:MAG: phosphoglycerate dehydrogenase [Bacillota bacterium]
MYKVLITTPTFAKYDPEPVTYLEQNGFSVVRLSRYPAKTEEIQQLIQDVDAVIVGLERIDTKLLNHAIKLKVISKHGVGVDNIDVAAARQRGITVTNVPHESARAVAELAFALMLACARNVVSADKAVRAGNWGPIFGFELKGKTLGVIGTGAIGSSLAEIALAFGMNVLGHDIQESKLAPALVSKGARQVDMDTCLKQSDVVSLHVPLTPHTRGLIGREELRKMKPTAILINTSRGEVVDQEALCEALQQGWIAAAGLDVLSTEPPEPGNPLLKMPNVVLTPHMGAYTYESAARTSMVAARNVVEVVLRGKPLHPVNVD